MTAAEDAYLKWMIVVAFRPPREELLELIKELP